MTDIRNRISALISNFLSKTLSIIILYPNEIMKGKAGKKINACKSPNIINKNKADRAHIISIVG